MPYKHTFRRHDKLVTDELTPVSASRNKCLDCTESMVHVRQCSIKKCTLHPYRMGMRLSTLYTPTQAIRQFCLDCSGSAHEVLKCPCTTCALYPYRMGKRPQS